MTNYRNSGNDQESSHGRLLRLLKRSSLALGAVFIAGGAIGAWWAKNYIDQDLAPLVEKNLQDLLGRPVKIGQVESFTLSGLRFASLAIPATATEADRVTAKGLDVQFSPLEVLFTRTLNLNITLIQPDVYIQQDQDGRWVTVEVKVGEEESFIKTQLQSVKIQNGDVELMPFSAPTKPKGSVILNKLGGIAKFPPDNQEVDYNINAQFARGGKIKIVGETEIATQQTNLQLSVENLLVSNISRLVELPIALQAGRLDADLKAKIPTDFLATEITGTAKANQISAKIPNVVQPISNFNGRFTFAGQTINVESLNTNFGKVPVVAKGTISNQTGFNLLAEIKPVSAKNILDTFKISSSVPPVGEVKADVQVQGTIQQPIVTGKVSSTKPIQVDRLLLQTVNTDFRLNVNETVSKLVVSNLKLVPAAGGQIIGSGEATLGNKSKVLLNVEVDGVSGDILAQSYGVNLPIALGNISAKAQVSGSLNQQPLKLDISTVQLTPPTGGQITASGQIQLAPQGKVNLGIQALNLPGNAIAQGYNFSTPLNIGGISANATVSGSLDKPLNVDISNLQASPEVGGQITANGKLQLAPQGRVALNILAQNLPGDAIAKAYKSSSDITIGNVTANAKISGSLDNLRAVAQVQAPGATYPMGGQAVINQQGQKTLISQAVLNVAGGTITAKGQVFKQRWQAFVNARKLQLSRFAQIPPEFQGVLNRATLNLSGSTANFQPSTIQARGRANLSVAGGQLNVSKINVNNGRWQLLANLNKIQLNRFSPELQGRLNSSMQLAGTTASFALADIQAGGNIRVSGGLPMLKKPLTAQVQWNGKQIIVQRASTQGVNVSGAIAVQFPETGTPEIADFNLDVAANNFNLKNTGFDIPGDITLAGLLDFNGKLTGTPAIPQATGKIKLRNLQVSDWEFDPVLAGNVNFQGGQGGGLRLTGKQDEIALNINGDYRPTSFLLRTNGAIAAGIIDGDNLIVNAQNFPLTLASSFLPKNQLQPGGKLSGNLAVNLNNYALAGEIAIAQPSIGRVAAKAFTANINYADGTASLANGKLQIADNTIAFSGNVQTGNDPQFQLQADFAQLGIQKLLQAVNIFDLQDLAGGLESPELATAKDLNTVPINLPNADLISQLKYFSEIETSTTKQQQLKATQTTATLPPLTELMGALNGGIKVQGSLKSGLNAGFNFQGANWQWGNYSINEILANGTFANDTVTLSPVRISTNQGAVAFSGQLGTEQLSGDLSVANLPLSLLQPFIKQYPIDVTGQLNANTTIGGSLEDPRLNGNIALANATVNQQPLQTAELNFNYDKARLNFDSTLLVTGTEPVKANGSVPAPLPFATAQPDNEQISINANVNNEGLKLLNLVTNNQVAWVDGQGKVDINVQGTLKEPIINGNVSLNNATVSSQALSKPLTDVTGTMEFNGNTLNVPGISGNYNQGQINVSGILPIFSSQAFPSNPFTVAITDKLDFQLPQLYQGDVSGDVIVRGTALKPQIGGEIRLSNGRVIIGESATPDSNNNTTPAVTSNSATISSQPISDATTQPATSATKSSELPISFTDLKIILGDGINVTTTSLLDAVPGGSLFSQPIVSFQAKGDLNINGTLAKPSTAGVIRLTGGRLSLFSTEFTLAKGYEQKAQFIPSQGLDPNLDIRLVALVPETSPGSSPILESTFSDEMNDFQATNFGTLRTVTVQASVKGSASKLSENLELTSEPRRSEAQIVSLLGGSILSGFGETDATQGLTNFASSTVLGGLQGTITQLGQAIGFSEFRIFPTPTTSESSASSIFNLSAEGVFNINGNFSASLSRPFSNDESFLYNLLYRVNDQILLRGLTNLGDRNQLFFEYESRF